jgi:DNA-binding NarL/FixJ family response regulator
MTKASGGKLRIGMVASDPMRIYGMQEILGDSAEIIALTAPATLHDADLDLVVLDEPDTETVLALIAAFRRARPALRLMVFGTTIEHDHIERVIAAGAKGYLTYTASAEETRMAVSVVQDGSVWAPRKILSRLIDARPQADRPTPEPVFTPREREVLSLLSAGRSNREIAASLSIDETTVKAHVSRLLRKVGVPNRVALTMHLLQRKMPPPGRR